MDDASPETGTTFTSSATVTNAGNAESAATTLRYYRSMYVPGAPAKPPARGDAGRVLADLAPAITLQNWTLANDRAPVRPTVVRYALQWEAMRMARARRCLTYDLHGIPTAPDPRHRWAGLYRFKTGFGGEVVHRWGCWDRPMNPFTSPLLRRAELLRRRLSAPSWVAETWGGATPCCASRRPGR